MGLRAGGAISGRGFNLLNALRRHLRATVTPQAGRFLPRRLTLDERAKPGLDRRGVSKGLP